MSTLTLRVEWRPWAKWLFAAMKASPWLSAVVIKAVGVDRFAGWLVGRGLEFKL